MTIKKKIQRRPISSDAGLVGLPVFLSRIYRARGVQSSEELELSLSQLQHSGTIKGLDEAVNLLLDALFNKLPSLSDACSFLNSNWKMIMVFLALTV